MLSPIKTKIKLSKSVGFDIETDVENNNRFVLGSLYFSDDEYYVFKDKQKMIDFFIDNRHKFDDMTVFAHNLGFDFLALFYESDDDLIKDFSIVQRGSDFICARSYIYDDKFNYIRPLNKHRKNKSYTRLDFSDTMNFTKFSLKKAGEIIDVPKYEKPDCMGRRPNNKSEWDELIRYNVQDSKVCKLFADFLQESFYKLNCQMSYTIASTSMDYFRRNGLKTKLWTPTKKDIAYLFKGYYGGRTEIINRGYNTELLNVYDFNSLYPSVMRDNLFPNPNTSRKINNPTIHTIKDFDGLCEARLESPDDLHIPYIPIRTDKLIFPKGHIKGYYTFYELRKALEYGYKIKSLNKGVLFMNNIDLFSDTIDPLYERRQEYKREKSPMELPTKILMNSLYGKFAQSIFDKNEIIHESNLTKEQFLSDSLEYIGNTRFIRVKKEYKKIPAFINPIISIYVTAYARTKLYESIYPIQQDVFYMDTDSVFTTRNLANSSKLGDLKKEYTAKEYYLVKPKFYAVRTTDGAVKCKIKGMHGLNQDITTFEDILKKPQASFMKFIKYREALIRSMLPNTKIDTVKTFNLEDTKRFWLNQKFSYKDFQCSNPIII